ncbi:MAG: MG2 domain-containing protein [Planctomycetes bacterium]|nr:MG2 domain-containing protein [Planctomycetota bacterium]
MRRALPVAVAALLAAALAGTLALGGDDLLDRARAAFADRDYARGASLFAEAVKKDPAGPGSDHAAMMVVRGLALAGHHEEAAAAGEAYLRDRPTSVHREMVAFLAGSALLTAGKGAEAAEMLGASVDRLAAPESRAAVAAACVAEGDKALAGVPPKDPFAPGTPPDPARALRLYSLARAAGLPAEGKAAVLLNLAKAAVEAKGFDAAIEALDERKALLPADAPDAEGLLLRGRALLGAGKADAAREALHAVVARAKTSPAAPEALFLLGDAGSLDLLSRDYPAHPLAPKAALRLGEVLLAAGDTARAVTAFLDAAARFPAAEEGPKAALAAADTLLEAGLFDEAKTRYGEFLERFKDRPEYAAARDKMLYAWYRDGARLIAAKEIEKGAGILAALRAAFPISPFAAKSLLVEARAVAPERALALLGEILARYPAAPEAPDAGLLVAEILGERPGRVADAVAALRRVAEQHKGSPAAERAEERLAEMRAESLEVELPAPILPGDPTDLVVRTRNLKKLTGRVYRLDPASYFRTRGSFAGFERVAVDVIASDAIFAGEVPAYEDYRRIEWKLRVPFEGEGAALVVLEGGNLRAAGLLLVSGLTVLVKESPFCVVAFAQDARSGEPVPGAKVLVRPSAGPLREAVTGADGTVRVDFADRSAHCDLLALRGDSLASEAFASVKRSVRGLATTFHVAADRPAYRPGQTVSYRAIVRRGAGEFHETPAGEPVKVTVHDATGNRLHFLDGTLSEFGTVAGSFELPADLPPGALEIVVAHATGYGKGAVRVEAYRKPQLLLEITPERPVVVRGEEAKIAVAVRYAFGLPVRDLPLAVHVFAPGLDRDLALVTDAAGRAEFTVPTETGPASALGIRVEATDATRRLYVAEAEVPLVAAAYGATVTAARADLVAGEEVRVRVLTADARGNPVAAEGKLEVGRAPPGTDEPRFVSVETLAVVTGPEGAADLFVTVKEPGRYRFRYRGLDRAGREVRAHADATATPGADRIIVRAARAEVAVGERIEVALRAPRAGLHALLAFEGEDVYGYRVVKFDGPEAAHVELASARHAPDVRIEVAAIAGGKLLLGSDRVTVRERILLTVTPERAGYLPGELCRLTLAAKDEAGNPVRAEVALAVADEGLFRLFPDRTPDLVKTFRPPDREHLVRTGASIDFAVRGVTTALSEDLKKERDRREKPAAAKAPPLLAEESLEEKKDLYDGPVNDAIGIGGGAGGEFGGRGGHRNLRALGGGSRTSGDLYPTRRQFEDTAFFRADVVTGADGTAVVEFPLPDDLAEWRITARGASHGNAFGEATSSFVTALPLVIRAALPRFLREGDRLTAGAGVVNGTGEALRATVELSPAAEDGAARAELDVAAGAEQFRPWPLPVAGIGESTFLAKVTAGPFADSEERKLPSLAYGIPWRDGFSGVASDGIERVLMLPEDFVPGTVKLTLHATPSPERLAADLWPGLRDFPHGCVEQTVDRFWPALELAAAIRTLGLDAAERLPGLDRAVKAGALRLTYLRNGEGLWGWFGKGGSDPEMTAFALLGLARAREAGVEIAPAVFANAKAALPALLAKTTDPDARAFLILAGARAFGADHAAPAAAFADRRRLGLAGLARLALAYEPLGKTTQGDMLVEEILAKLATPAGESTEALGFALAALCGADVSEERLWPAFFALAARREGDSFGSTRESGVALFALARAAARGLAFEGGEGTFTVTVNGQVT